jgi:two-component system OmpR family response regulator
VGRIAASTGPPAAGIDDGERVAQPKGLHAMPEVLYPGHRRESAAGRMGASTRGRSHAVTGGMLKERVAKRPKDETMRILLVEDDAEVARFVKKGLQEAGHNVEHASNGRDGLFLAASEQFDMLVLDRMLPGGVDGVRLVETLRSQGNRTPVLFLSALSGVDEKVKGLKAGGDDYLTKPFAFAELLARVEALGRRPSVDAPATKLRVADLELDLLSRNVTRAGKRIDVQPREFRLLEHLMRHAGQVVTRTMLLEKVWDYHFDPQTNVIDVHVSRLRQKLDKGFDKPLIHTVRNAGYMIRAEP